MELNFFDYSDNKRYYSEPDVIEYDKDSKQRYDLSLGTETMTDLDIVLDFKTKMISIDEIMFLMRNVNLLQGTSTLRMLKLNNSLANEAISTQDATKCATWLIDAKYNKVDLQSNVIDDCKQLSANHQKKLLQLLMKYELLFDGTFGDRKTKPVSFQSNEENTIPWPSFPSTNNTQGNPYQGSVEVV